MIYVKGIPGRTAEVEGHSFLFFTGFAYLGMPTLPAFQQLVLEGAQKYGAVFPSSRVSNTRSLLYEAFEDALSKYVQQAASACFSSGYLAAQAAVQFAAEDSLMLYPQCSHPSLRVYTQKKDMAYEGTTEFILEKVQASTTLCTIVLESVDPLSGKASDFDWLLKIEKRVRVIVDDSHGIGILGDRGEGVVSLLPKQDHLQYLICYSLSKAFSCEGGAISGDTGTINQIKLRPPFSAATPMSPAFVHTWMEGRILFAEQREKLLNNCRYFSKQTATLGTLNYDRRLPVARIAMEDLYEHALKHHILLSAFRYPTEADPLMTRVVLNALHTREDIDRVAHCIATA